MQRVQFTNYEACSVQVVDTYIRRTDLTAGLAIGEMSFEKEQQALVLEDVYVPSVFMPVLQFALPLYGLKREKSHWIQFVDVLPKFSCTACVV